MIAQNVLYSKGDRHLFKIACDESTACLRAREQRIPLYKSD